MRLDWISASAAALIIGSFSLVLGFLLNPLSQEQSIAQSLGDIDMATSQWLASAASLFFASVGMTLGVPALLSLLAPRFRRFALVAAGVFTFGTIGMSGYGFIMMFLRALALSDALVGGKVDDALKNAGLASFLGIWLGCFLLGLVLLAVGMLRVDSVPRWVPVLLLLFVLSQLLPDVGGDIGTVVQFLALAVAMTGAALAAHAAVVEHA
ncbi:MAG TPA: hypothetical protein VFO98_15325 [Marmoricola sp.]|jgi:hypothetical protein|nr:hypothetical protein [Marmoricola sp.]